MNAPLRLTPTMASRKLQALDFIKSYFARWGHSPSLDEIAAGLGVSRQRAHELVAQLSAEERIRHEKGKRRGLRLVDPAGAMTVADAILRLKAEGWTVDDDFRTAALPPAMTPMSAPLMTLSELAMPDLEPLTKDELTIPVELEQIPDV